MQRTNVSTSTQVRSSKIQVQIREIPVVSKQVVVRHHDVDGDGGDVSNE
ncbi:hypothetical protein J5X98_18145 [Leptothermofonsia sichuanensis E412]|nr:hypothetical protein [Leptothermofonsia sichuanensis]QZZ19299.1 hypothetical protein J5X98_18145 [Leptothermofonsia sichuanensis E412]